MVVYKKKKTDKRSARNNNCRSIEYSKYNHNRYMTGIFFFNLRAVLTHFFKISNLANGFTLPKRHNQNTTTENSNATMDFTLENKTK